MTQNGNRGTNGVSVGRVSAALALVLFAGVAPCKAQSLSSMAGEGSTPTPSAARPAQGNPPGAADTKASEETGPTGEAKVAIDDNMIVETCTSRTRTSATCSRCCPCRAQRNIVASPVRLRDRYRQSLRRDVLRGPRRDPPRQRLWLRGERQLHLRLHARRDRDQIEAATRMRDRQGHQAQLSERHRRRRVRQAPALRRRPDQVQRPRREVHASRERACRQRGLRQRVRPRHLRLRGERRRDREADPGPRHPPRPDPHRGHHPPDPAQRGQRLRRRLLCHRRHGLLRLHHPWRALEGRRGSLRGTGRHAPGRLGGQGPSPRRGRRGSRALHKRRQHQRSLDLPWRHRRRRRRGLRTHAR
jgi:hypothetical protein